MQEKASNLLHDVQFTVFRGAHALHLAEDIIKRDVVFVADGVSNIGSKKLSPEKVSGEVFSRPFFFFRNYGMMQG